MGLEAAATPTVLQPPNPEVTNMTDGPGHAAVRYDTAAERLFLLLGASGLRTWAQRTRQSLQPQGDTGDIPKDSYF